MGEPTRREADLAVELRDAQLLQSISNQLVSEPGPNGHYAKIVEAARALMRSDAASIQELDGSRLKLVGHLGFHPQSAGFWEWVDAGVGSACGRALLARQRYVISDTNQFDASPDDLAAFRRSGIASVQSTPLVSRAGAIVGMLSTHWHRPHLPDDANYTFFDVLTRLAADFIERTHSDAALRDSEEKYRTLFETMGQGYAELEIIRGPDGRATDARYLELNPQYERLTGIPVAEARGRTMLEMIPDLDDWWIQDYDRIVRSGRPGQVENQVTATGRWYEAKIYPRSGDRFSVLYEEITVRKEAEAALRESEERLRMALEAGRMGTWRYDLKTGAQRWSDQQFRLFGLEPGGAPPTRELFLSLVHPDDQRLVEYGPDDLLPDRGLLDAEFRVIRPDGQIRWLVAHTVVQRDGAGQATEMIGLNWDITERKHAEDALRDSEEGLQMALEAGRMGTYRFDVRTGIEQWSDGEYELLGLKRTDAPPTRELFLSLVHPEDLHLVQYTEDDERAPGTSLDSEFRIVRPDTGEVRYLTAHALARFGPDGRPAELIGVNQDVTEERRTQEAQRTTEERLQQFSRASSDVLWIRNVETLQWEYLSPAFDHIYGLTRQDALKNDNYRSWLSFIVPEDREAASSAIERVAAGERVAFEYRIRRPDGELRWLRNTDFPIHDQNGRVTHIAGVGSDITAMRQAEEHRRFLLAELQHRVRNTLAVIRSITRRTADTTDSKESFFTHLDGRIAAFARVQGAVTRDPTRGVDLGLLLADELRVVGAQEGREVTIEGPPVALAPKAAETLGLAIHELATNAIKHGSLASGGAIEVAWEIDGGKQLSLTWTEHGASRPVEPPRRKGFGTEILERTLAYELKASTRMEFRSQGLVCRIEVPLDQVTNT